MGNSIVYVNRRRFQIIRKIATGGFSYVYEAKDGETDQHVAIKYIACFENEQVEMALKEIELHRMLEHPNILRLITAEVRLKQQGILKSSPHQNHTKEALLVFPLYRDGSLQDYLDKCAAADKAAFSEVECLHIFLQIVRAVQVIHQAGLAHRDIKPGNILLDIEQAYLPRPILMDLGSATMSRVEINSRYDAINLQETAAVYSSAAYRAPELYDASSYQCIDERTDVWSLGCLLYAMAFGPYSPFESPIEGVQVLGILNGNIHFVPNHTARNGTKYSNGFAALIKYMLNPNAKLRPYLANVEEETKKLLRGDGSTRALDNIADANPHGSEHSDEDEFGEFCVAYPTTRSSSNVSTPRLPRPRILSATRIAIARSQRTRSRRAKSQEDLAQLPLQTSCKPSLSKLPLCRHISDNDLPSNTVSLKDCRQRTCSDNSYMINSGRELFSKAMEY